MPRVHSKHAAMLAAYVSYHRKQLFPLGIGSSKLSPGSFLQGLVPRERKGDVCSMRPLPLGSHSPSGDHAEWKPVERCAGEGGQLLEAAWGCDCGALRQSFPTGEPSYDPPPPEGRSCNVRGYRSPCLLSQCSLPMLSFSM